MEHENLKETTQSLIFELEVPYYMELQQVLALDAGKNVDIQKIGDQGGVKTYLVVYSTTVNNALPPNSMANNPRAIMRLFIDFVDLPPYTLIIPIKNIMAYSLDGRVINQTKEMSLVIDFLEKVYWPRFEKGDVNKQFGDGQLTQADIDKLKKFISGELVPTLYEAWASDMNNDGKINIYDLTILQNLVYGTTEVTDNTDDGIITVRGRLVSFDFTNITQVDLSVYDYLGSQIKHLSFSGGQGQADLSDIYQGVYFIKINNHLVKVLF